MSMFRFDAIVFDFDGVLVQSVDVKTRAFATLYEPYGADVVQRVTAWHLEHGGVSRYEKFRYFHETFLNQKLLAAEEAKLADCFSALVEEAVIAAAWVPGAHEFLETYASRLAFFVASGTPEEELRRIIKRRMMTRYFIGVAGSPRRKGEILRFFLRHQNIPPHRMLMVGDAMTDYVGATEANIPFLGITPEEANPFPLGVPVLPDLTRLAAFIVESEHRLSETA